MPPRSWPQRVQDILGQIERVRRHTDGVDWPAFQQNEVLQDDVLYRLQIIGEAIAYIPEEVKARYPGILWRAIRETRNVVTHIYFGVDLARIWRIVEHDLPELAERLRALTLDDPQP